ncbi:MAG TPA: hypothetical protein PLX97_16645 [Gemmatales bacterium]|nr:hypothetical protein [Gemmatales bacterium]
MTNVVQFKRKVVVEAPKTKWDEVYNQCGEFPEYKLVALMLAMSWCYQTGQGPIGDRLLAAARASGFSPFVQLEKELGDAIERIDMKVAMYGTEAQRAEK